MGNKTGSRLFVFGYFGYQSNQLDGQTIKTRNLHKLLEEHHTMRVPFFDTENLKKSKLSIIPAILRLIQADKLIYIPAQRSLKWLFPVIYILSKIFRFKILYIVVGGWLPAFISKNGHLISKLKRIDQLFTETNILKDNLASLFGISNVSVLPNFRIHNFSFISKQKPREGLKCVFLSRIHRLKGYDLIIRFALETEKEISFDFYGPIEKSEEHIFLEKISTCPKTKYKGVLQPQVIYETLSQYDVFVFPTQYYTEGLPGAIVDAFIAGLPVVASEWAYAREFIDDNFNGFIFPFENGYNKFEEILNRLYFDTDLLTQMKINANSSSSRYNSENAWAVLSKYVK